MAGLASKVIVLRSSAMGEGDQVLGETILAGFLHMIVEQPEKPRAIFCYNAGVKLLAEGSPVLAHLQEVAELGVPIQACKTCVDYLNLRDSMKVGEISTMGQFMEYMQHYEIVTL